MYKYTISTIPQELQQLKQWARWIKGTRDKMPANLDNTAMKWGDHSNWLAFDQVARFDKIGWFPTPEAGILVVDLDGCRNKETGEIDPMCLAWIEQARSYAEISPSETGVKFYIRGTLAGNKPLISKAVPWAAPGGPDGHYGIEIYAEKHFITVTGNILPGCPIEINAAPDVLNDMLVRFSPAPKGKKDKPQEPVKNGWDFSTWVRHNLDVQDNLSDGFIITCPWAHEHTTPGDTARIWEGPPHTFHCFHAHCADRLWEDVRLKVDPAYKKSQFQEFRTQDFQPSGNGNGHHASVNGLQIDLCQFTADDAGNSDAMYSLFGQDFLYCGARGWFTYTGTHWELDPDGAAVKREAIETLRRRRHAAVDADNDSIIKCTKADERRVNGCINLFRTLVGVSIDEFDKNPDQLNCKNGVIDLRTGAIEPHTRYQRFTYCLPVDYSQADYSAWLGYLNGVVGGGQQVIDYLQQALGYSFTGHTQEEILFYLFGPTRSGKGTFAETIMSLLPTPISKMVDFNSFTAKREGDVSNFDLAPLKPSRIIFASESNRSQSLNPAKIKQLTGGDHITCCFKHKDFFEYRPQFKVWMMSNHPVNGDPEDDALWGRGRVIEFPNSFLGIEDKELKANLKKPEALKGVLYWIVEGAMKWYALGAKGLTTPDAIAKTTQAQRAELDYVQQWIDEEAQVDDVGNLDLWTPNEVVMASYTAWCKNNNVQYPKGPKALAQSLKAKGFNTGQQKWINSKNKKGVGGLYIFRPEKPNDS